MNTKPPTNQPLILKCPHCKATIKIRKKEDWFPCPHCGQMVRKQVNKDRSYFLEAGARTETVRPIQFKDAEKKVYPPTIKTMPLSEVIEYKVTVENKLSKMKSEKEKVGGQINLRIKKNLNTEDLRDQLKHLDIETDNLKAVLEQLNSMEIILTDERRDAIRGSDNSSSVFLWSLIAISIGVLIIFWIAAIVWNWKIILSTIVIIFVTSIILSSVAAPRKE